MSPARLVIDANILIRAALGSRVPEMIAGHSDSVVFVAPPQACAEATTHLPAIAERRGWDAEPFMEALGLALSVVATVDDRQLAPFRDEALARVRSRDVDDWPVLAAALALDCPVWTEDQDFFGTGVATWTTDRVHLYLEGASDLQP